MTETFDTINSTLRGAGFDDQLFLEILDPSSVPIVSLVDVGKLFRDLRSRGLKVGVLTSDARFLAEAFLDTAGVEVDSLVCGDDGYGMKPSPAPLETMCKQLGVLPETVVMVGDSAHDIACAHRAGARSVGVLTGVLEGDGGRRALLDLGPDHVLESVAELVPVIDEWRTQSHRNTFLKVGGVGGGGGGGGVGGGGGASGGDGGNDAEGNQLGLILLNTPMSDRPVLRSLFESASISVCADGAANRLYDIDVDRTLDATTCRLVPTAITGDLDSARIDVLEHYRQHGTCVVPNLCQNHNDFEKALRLLEQHAPAVTQSRTESSGLSFLGVQGAGWACGDPHGGDPTVAAWTVVVYGAFGDRLDHEMASINLLFRSRQFDRIILVGERNVAFLLRPGRHRIVPEHSMEGPTCGLIPVGGRCDSVTTSGLKWNLDGQVLEFGGLVSSSNEILVDEAGHGEVLVETSHPLLWTVVLQPGA